MMRTGRFCQSSGAPAARAASEEAFERCPGFPGRPRSQGRLADGLPRLECVCHARAHDAREDGDGEALGEAELTDRLGLLILGKLALLGDTRHAAESDAQEAQADAAEHDLARGLPRRADELAAHQRRDEGPEGGAEAEGDGVPEGDPEIPHGEAEGEAAHAPEHAEEESEAQGPCRGGHEHLRRGGHDEESKGDGRHHPTEDAAREPVVLPGPALHALVGDVEARSRQSTDGMEKNAEERVRRHGEALPSRNDLAGAYFPCP